MSELKDYSTNGAVLESSRSAHRVAVCLLLAAAIATVFGQTVNFGFIHYDDPKFVYENRHINDGMTAKGLSWCFTGNPDYWRPVSMISHMLDCELFKLHGGGHHLTSVLLHGLNTLLLFGLFRQMTGKVWPSALVAALFGLHPLHVESVAWIAERKDVLSATFALLATSAYVAYTRRPNMRRFLLATVLFAMGLISKPMIVTLPMVWLLMDYWPLKRLPTGNPRRTIRVFTEKIPLLVLSAAICLLTIRNQQQVGAMVAADAVVIGDRIDNAVVSYLRYLGKTIWPEDLAVLYTHPYLTGSEPWSAASVGAAWTALVVITSTLFGQRQRYLLVGWLWFLGTLVPVIGVVQVGGQAMADRYTYIPLVGLFIMVAWAAPYPLTMRGRVPMGMAVVGILVACTITAWLQTRHWETTRSIFEHTLRAEPDSATAHQIVGTRLRAEGQSEEALYHLQKALELSPLFAEAHNSLGRLLYEQEQFEQAANHFVQAIKIKPSESEGYNNLGMVYLDHDDYQQAIECFEEAIKFNQKNAKALNNLGRALVGVGDWTAAIPHFQNAIQLTPDRTQPLNDLAWILSVHPDPNIRNPIEALQRARRAANLTSHQDASVLDTLAAAYAANGRFEQAVETAQKAIELAQDQDAYDLEESIRERLGSYKENRPFHLTDP